MARAAFPMSAETAWKAALRRLARLAWFDRTVPARSAAPNLTHLDLWRQARIEYLTARDRRDTRGMGQACLKMREHADAQFAEMLGRTRQPLSPRAPSA